MICRACRQQRHEQCPGGSWCDCQHQAARSGTAGDAGGGGGGGGPAGGPDGPAPDRTTSGG